jgi:membrane protease YdiL (CAAX protease family)
VRAANESRRVSFPRASRKQRDQPASGSPNPRPRSATGAIASKTLDSSPVELRPFEDAAAAPGFWPIVAICVTACAGLLIYQYGGSEQAYLSLYPPHGPDPYWVLRVKAWWVGGVVIGFVALPATVMVLLPGNRLRDCNLGFRGFRDHFWIYVGLYGLMLPVIWIVSLSPAFTAFYPMYGQAGRSWADLLMWEGMYVLQFVGLEFFFRGFLVGGLGRQLGIFAVPAAVLPYMMLHFSKLAPEASASVVAGLVLGYLAWKTKSIWGGVCIHCAVAVTMDLLALAHKGQLPWLHP